jgi:hypothetical protein
MASSLCVSVSSPWRSCDTSKSPANRRYAQWCHLCPLGGQSNLLGNHGSVGNDRLHVFSQSFGKRIG